MAGPINTTQRAASEESEPEISLDRYAEVMAHMLYFGHAHSAELLKRLDVDSEAWTKASRTYPEAIARESVCGRLELAERFVEALTPVKQRLEAERPLLSEIGQDTSTVEIGDDASGNDLALATDDGEAPAPDVKAAKPLTSLPGLDVEPGPPLTLPSDPAAGARAPAPPMLLVPTPAPAPPSAFTSEAGPVTLPMPVQATAPVVPFASRPPTGPAAPTKIEDSLAQTAPIGATLRTTAAPAWVAMEKHAALCAELALDPTKAPEILGRYGLTVQAKQDIDAQWRSRFAAMPSLWKAWQIIYHEKVTRLRGGRS